MNIQSGVDPGENFKSEFGGYLRIFLKKTVMENITFHEGEQIHFRYLVYTPVVRR